MGNSGDGPPPVLLWAVPRSVSTAFEKTFAQRADFTVIHEPFTDCYYFGPDRRSRRYGDQPSRSGYTARAACQAVSESAGKRVFAKDLCFQAEPYVDEAFLEKVTSTFILRAPQVVLASLAPLKPDFTEDEFGYTAMERLWKRVTSVSPVPPVVVEGDRFRESPRATLEAYCQRIGVPFSADMLYWEHGAIRRWEPHERDSQAKWHSTLESSHGILPVTGGPKPARKPELPAHLSAALATAERIYEMIVNSPGALPGASLNRVNTAQAGP